ncbi:hypothetical protein CFK40_18245 [Virgibacillus necropolis]|uniref:Uncharacterized protein n=1 Tax=Virgibacillus necropolis TaxID=163877 RepID=A0A221MGS7_9BACI|nr:hypothetical protein CFK40_18245 [Virgibacillus necropolis]
MTVPRPNILESSRSPRKIEDLPPHRNTCKTGDQLSEGLLSKVTENDYRYEITVSGKVVLQMLSVILVIIGMIMYFNNRLYLENQLPDGMWKFYRIRQSNNSVFIRNLGSKKLYKFFKILYKFKYRC